MFLFFFPCPVEVSRRSGQQPDTSPNEAVGLLARLRLSQAAFSYDLLQGLDFLQHEIALVDLNGA
jgi:hypothetical protein